MLGLLLAAAVAGGTQPYETYETVVAEDHPAAQFRFDDAAGSTTLADSAGSYTATNNGITLGGQGPFGGSKSGLFGGEAYATLPSSPLSGATEFTAEAWVNWSGGSYKQPIFDFGSSASNYMYLTPSSGLAKHPMLFEIHTSGGSVAQVTAPKLAAKSWKLVTVTETASGTLTLYLDGEPVGQPTSTTLTPASLAQAPSDYLGKSLPAGEPDLKGSLSNVAFYTRTLSGERVLEHYYAAEFPVNTAPPTISGTARAGKKLTAKPGTWTGLTPITFAYQWERCKEGCAAIEGARESSYEAKNADVGSTLRVLVTATNRAGAGTATSAQTAPVEAIKLKDLTLPVISGSAEVGQELTVSDGTWEGSPPSSYKYKWEACNSKGAACKAIAAATAQTYEPVASQVTGKDTLRAIVTAENFSSSASATSAATAVIAPGPPRDRSLPTITGTAEDGKQLTAEPGTWAGSEPFEYSYHWQLCNAMGSGCEGIEGATAATYEVVAADAGYTLDVLVTAKNTVGSASASSAVTQVVPSVTPSNTAPPTISGSTEEGQTLTASTGSWTGSAPFLYGYQWQSCNEHGEDCQEIEGASSASYQLGPGDVGDTLRVLVTASNDAGFATAGSSASAVITTAVTAPLSLAAPEVSGSAQQGQTLVADSGTWTGTSPLAYAYQWESCDGAGESCADVAGATGPTYQLAAGDVGDTLRVLVTASNAAGVASRVSPASALVAGPPPGSESACNDTWVGSSEGSWQEGANWSAGSAPGAGAIACIGAETTVRVSEAGAHAGILEDAGALVISGGSLELTNASEASTLAALTLSGSNSALTGAGSVYVSGGFDWGPDAIMSGSGSTIVESGVSGTIEAGSGCEPMTLSGGRTLVNEGTLTFGWGTLYMSEGARLENDGSFADDSEASCLGPQIQPEGSGPAPAILNAGTFEKAAGSGTGTVAVEFTNDGAVDALTGTLELTGGGVPEQSAIGTWSVQEGASIVLGGGTFLIGEAVDLSAVTVEGATVTRTSAPVPVNTASPSVEGRAEDGQTLTADAGSWSGTQPISYAYRWQRCNGSGQECRSIAKASGQSYALTASDVGATVRVIVTASNAYGQASAPSSASSVVLAPGPPSNTAPPQITGVTQDGSVLSASTGSWNAAAPVSYTYQWESCDRSGEECAPVEYANTPEYQLGEGDIGSTLRVLVTATNAGGTTHASSSATAVIEPEAVSELEAPSITGVPDEHQVLDADPGRWGGTETQLSYQWESCDEGGAECAPIEGATGTEYDLAEGDLATTLRVRVGASNALDALSDVSAATPVIGAPSALADASAPSISGVAQVGQTLTADPGSWSGAGAISYAYQWQSCDQLGSGCADIAGASATTYAPPASEVASTLRVLVTATDGQGHEVSLATHVTPPVASSRAPAVESPPQIAGAALVGHTLTAGTGVIAGEGPISYAYQWERCTQAASCTVIEGADHSSYTIAESDLGSSLLVLVSATDAGGSTVAASAASATVGPEALRELSAPSISGVVQLEGTLTAAPGIWSGSGPVSYAYRWESCGENGEDCAPIEGADEATYALGEGDLGSTLRVKVTASDPLGASSATSARTTLVASDEVSVAGAQEVAQQTDPALLAVSTTATLDGQSITPALTDAGGEVVSQGTLTSSTLSKEAVGELAVNTPAGEISLAPVEPLPRATTLPTIVNGSAALLANTWPATDTIARASALGASAYLQLRSAQAPRTFSWQVHLGPDQELEQLPNGSVAVLESSQETTTPSGAPEPAEAPSLGTTGEAPAESGEERAEAEQAEAEAGKEEETPLETLPSSPTSSAPPAEAPNGQPQPQQTQSSYEAERSAMSYAEAQTAGKALMVIAPPAVTDAYGSAVSAYFTVAGATLTLTVKPPAGSAYPVLAQLLLAAPTNQESIERDPVKFGISDPKAQEKGNIDEHFEEQGNAVAGFDPRLFDGPPYTSRHMRTARLIVPFDVLGKATPYRTEERHTLEAWLTKVKKQGLEPYITIGQDFSKDPCLGAGAPKPEQACPQPSPQEYKKFVTQLMKEVIRWHSSRGWPLVKLWGAWNEPDAAQDPLHKDEARAAQFWEIARATLQDIAPHYPCSGCTVVAGEFSTFYPDYTSCYRNMLLYNYCHNPRPRHPYTRYWFGKPRTPTAWGFHDYQDLIDRNNDVARDFAHFAQERLGKPRLFMSEAGVELQDGEAPTALAEPEGAGTTEAQRAEKRELQLKAAEQFLSLPSGLSYPIDRMYYYEYAAPTKKQQEEHKFDSALVEQQPGKLYERPAYCVLAYPDHRCPPIAETGPGLSVDALGAGGRHVTVTGFVNPEGLNTEYRFEYGSSTTAYGGKSPLAKLAAGMSRTEVSGEIILPEGDAGCNTVLAYFRIEATNPTGTRYGGPSEVHGYCPD